MKLLLTLAMLLSGSAWAREACSLYELKGKVVVIDHYLHMVVAEKTGSEKVLKIPVRIQADFSPYVNKTVAGTFTLSGNVIQTRQQILSAQDLKFAVLDPLAENERTVSRKIKEVPCPK